LTGLLRAFDNVDGGSSVHHLRDSKTQRSGMHPTRVSFNWKLATVSW